MALRSRAVSRRYQIGRRIATGERSEVYEARSEGLDAIWALKRLRGPPGEDLEARLVREAAAAAALDHPCVVSLIDAGQFQGEYVLVSERVDGLNLAELLRGLRAKDQTIPIEIALGLASSIAQGLAHAHGRALPDGTPFGVLHLHLSPENVLLSRSGEVKLVDFGAAHLVDRGPSEPGIIHLPNRYTAPELARNEAADARADLFSLGALLLELVLGEPLYPERPIDHILGQLTYGAFVPIRDRAQAWDPDLLKLLEDSTHPEREARLGSARSFERRLDQFRASRGLVLDPDAVGQFLAPFVDAIAKTRPEGERGRLEGTELVLPPEHLPSTDDLVLPNRESVAPPSGPVARPKRKTRMERLVRAPDPKLPRPPSLPRPQRGGPSLGLQRWAWVGLALAILAGVLLAILRG